MTDAYQYYADKLARLREQNNYRYFKEIERAPNGYIKLAAATTNSMLDLSSNDYLGLSFDKALLEEFKAHYGVPMHAMGSASSRLLTGQFEEHAQLESLLAESFGRSALVFNSGYHTNLGILPALADEQSLIVSDELIHASMIDGIRLSKARRRRFKHQDYAELEQILIEAAADDAIDKVFVVMESVYSMDGDVADLRTPVDLKLKYPKVMLYVDEAHGIGVFGERGLGVAEAQGVLSDIDFLVGAFGKAIASVGGYLICAPVVREYLINQMRPLIFSTNLPPINAAWTFFAFKKMLAMQKERAHLQQLSADLRQAILARGLLCHSQSHIVPIIYGANHLAMEKAEAMQSAGFYVLPIRYPTVPQGQARVRVSLHAALDWQQLEALLPWC
ncbi:8-amino-7-oxononanoate synthase [Oligella sp. MSHR50489EDL]|uniref:aminotransferase class I/II-fold pyridoxal phosphate-dependent enzyme n=1 Tax=Oligella sp. MSHR50489EDL TaxID=3139409 RepID=UPI003D8186B3